MINQTKESINLAITVLKLENKNHILYERDRKNDHLLHVSRFFLKTIFTPSRMFEFSEPVGT